MKTAHHRFAVAILALLVLPVPAWGADPIKAELDGFNLDKAPAGLDKPGPIEQLLA